MKMICKNCGTENKDTAKFCKKCGTELKQEEKTVEAMSEVKTEPVARKCPACGAEVSETAVFCKHCGHKLDEAVKEEKTVSGGEEETVLLGNGGKAEGSNGAGGGSVVEATPAADSGTSGQGNIYNNVHIEPNYNNMTVDQLPAKYKPIGAWAYFGWTLLFSIPIAGLIVALVFALGSTENINLRNFARSMFCYLAVVLLLALLMIGGMGCTAGMML